MATAVRDLWPADIGVTTLITPVSILREQATLLGEKTKHLVDAEVVSTPNGPGMVHSFILVAPAIGGYKYRLLRVIHNVDVYPLTLHFEPTNTQTEASNQEDFEKQLGSIFSSDKTQNIVKSLIAQSQQ